MKEIKAYIKPQKLSAVTLALHEIENLTGVSVVQVKGFGRSRIKNDPDQISDDWVFYVPHVKIEMVCLDEMVDQIVSTIQKAA
ncbi:MAG: P-II family nitrogen regulator, partial [Nitrospinales bacterium]